MLENLKTTLILPSSRTRLSPIDMGTLSIALSLQNKDKISLLHTLCLANSPDYPKHANALKAPNIQYLAKLSDPLSQAKALLPYIKDSQVILIPHVHDPKGDLGLILAGQLHWKHQLSPTIETPSPKTVYALQATAHLYPSIQAILNSISYPNLATPPSSQEASPIQRNQYHYKTPEDLIKKLILDGILS